MFSVAKAKLLVVASLFSIFFIGCSTTATAMLDVKATADSTKLSAEKAYGVVSSILVDKGFDIKIANKDIGLITTEYKKFGAVEQYGQPAFDYYLQIKNQIKTRPDGKVQITLTPVVKASNRLNASAFTEEELYILSDEEQKKMLNAQQKTELSGQLLFMNVVQGVADATGLSVDQLEYNKQIRNIPMKF